MNPKIPALSLLAATLGLPALATPARGASAPVRKTTPTKTAPRVSAPPLGKPRPLRLPPIVQKTLTNGVKIVVLEDHTQPALWMRLAVPAGSLRDPDGKMGLAQMTAGLLDKGTASRSETEISDTVDGLGAALGASAEEDTLTVSASGLSTHADTLLDLLADITLRPTFPQEEIDRLRTRTLNAITADLADPASLANAAINRVVYGGHPYGNYASGTPATLPAITQGDIQKFHDTFFQPDAATLFIVGDITPEQAAAKVEKAFGGWARTAAVPDPPAPPAPAGRRDTITLIDRPGAAQTEIRIGVLTPGYRDPRRIVGSVATAVLGLGQFESRLTKEIRVKRGLTYGAASFFDRKAQAGAFEITTFTKNPSTGEVIKIALDETQRLMREPPAPAELADRKNFLIGTFAVSVATPNGILRRLVPAVLYGGGPDDLRLYTPRVQSVTASQVQQLVRDLGVGGAHIVLVGDAKEIEKQLAPLGNVTKISQDALDLGSPTLVAQTPDLPTGAVTAPQTATPADQASSRARLEATLQALGGAAFLGIRQIVMRGSGEIAPPGAAGDALLPLEAVTLTAAPPDRSRLEMKTALGDFVIGSPGGGAPGWMQAMGQTRAAPAGGIGAAADPFQLLRRAADPASGTTVGPLPAGDKDGPGFVVTDDKGRTSAVYVAADTNLIRRIVNKTPRGDVVIALGDYKSAEGDVRLPGSMRVSQDGREFLRLTFSAFEINKPVEDALFARPKETQK